MAASIHQNSGSTSLYADLPLNVPLVQMYFQEDNVEDVKHYKTEQMTADFAFP